MATTKKYVSLEKLGLYDEKIKGVISAGDTKALDDAMAYANSLAENYEPSGAIATAKTELEGKISAAQGAADAAAEAAAKAQGEVDALELVVGTLPEGTEATSVVDYVNKKTEGIATEGAMTELSGRVTTVEGKVSAIEKDYLKAADKTELSDAIGAEKTRAEGIEAGLRTDVNAIKEDYLKAADKTALQNSIDGVADDVAEIAGDYLKAADKTELQGKIDAKAAQTALDAEVERATGVEEGLQTQINTIMNNPDAEGAINSINEFTQYVKDHGSIADGFRTDIDKNKGDIAAEVKRAGEAESALSGRLDTLEAIDHDAYVAADTALENKLNGEIAKKADASALTSAVQALEGADTEMAGRLDAIEAQLGDGEGSVADMIADAKQEAIDAADEKDAEILAQAKTDASNKDAVVLAEAQKAAGAVQTALDTHTGNGDIHVTAEQKTSWTTAAGKAHVHSNLSVLEGITAAKITEWDKVSGKAEQTALQAEIDRATAAEEALGARIDEFVECSQEDINALFA